MVERMEVPIAGEPMQLWADRALFWPARRRLLIADLHLGKGDVFRAAGISVPTGGTLHDLTRLDGLLRLSDAVELWVLGDFLHGGHHSAVDVAWRDFRHAHAGVRMAVVSGNHDRGLNGAMLGIDLLGAEAQDPPFCLRHAPSQAADPLQHVICGHVHPVVRLPGMGRWPVFWLTDQQTILPAFSAFSGGWAVPDAPGQRRIACNGTALVALDD